jgi:hypothetical protein
MNQMLSESEAFRHFVKLDNRLLRLGLSQPFNGCPIALNLLLTNAFCQLDRPLDACILGAKITPAIILFVGEDLLS